MMTKIPSFPEASRFELRAELGQGAMGRVYRVHDREIGRDVALKTMHRPGPDEVLRLKGEFRSLAGVSHPNVLQLHELFVGDDLCFFTMELVEGTALSTFIRRDLAIAGGASAAGASTANDADADLHGSTLVGPVTDRAMTLDAPGETLPFVQAPPAAPPTAAPPEVTVSDEAWARLRAVVRQLVLGLSALHASGIVHRDVKPANVLVSEGDRVTLLDFGLVTALGDGDGERSREIAGTPAYMAPEQARGGAITRAADLYAVGVILYEALTGVLPFEGAAKDILHRKVRFAPRDARALAPGAPADLAGLAMDLLAADPLRRPGVEACLDRLAPGLSATAFDRGEPAPGGSFVGRAAELAALEAALEEVTLHRRKLAVHVHGPSGIGKSTLVRELCAGRAHDPLVLRGRCHPAESVPYRALDAAIDDLARHLDTLPDAAVRDLVPAGAHALLHLFPVLAKLPAFRDAPAPAVLPDARELRRQGSAALRDLCAALGRTRPVVLWLDDVQWGDLDSAPLLDDLLGPPASPLLLLCTYRSDERDRSPLIRHLLLQEPREIELGALGAGEVADLARAILGTAGAAEIAAVVAESEGNPFIAGEMARHVGARGARRTTRAPMNVTDLVLDRIGALDAGQRSVLEVAALAGRPLDRSVALAAAGLDRGQRPMLARLRDANLLRDVAEGEGSAVVAYHDRIREVVLGAMSEGRRVERHRGIAEALEAQEARDHESLAHHWEGAGEPRRAGDHALLAADRAAAALAFDRAAELYTKALALSGAHADRAATEEKLGDALANLGRAPDAARSYLAAAGRIHDAGRATALRRRAAEQYLEGGYVDEGWREMRGALEALGVPIPGSFGRALGAAAWRRVIFLLGRFDAKKRAFPPSLPAAERPRLDALWTASTSMSMVSPHLADAFRMTHLLRALRVGDASTVCRALAYEAAMETHLGGALLDRSVDRLLDQVGFLAGVTGDPYDEAWHALALANVGFTRGTWRKTAAACRRADALFRERCPGTAWERVTVAIFHHFALAWLGELPELFARVSALAADARRRGDVHALCEAYVGEPMLAWLAADRGEEARAGAAEALARQAPRSRSWPEKGYRRQQYAALIAEGYLAHHGGDPWPAWTRMLAHWPDLKASFLLPLRCTGIELRWARARAALAAAATMTHDGRRPPGGVDARWTRRALLADVRAQVGAVEKDALALGKPVGQLLRAGVARIEGRTTEAAHALAEAVEGFDRLEMALHREAARLALGLLTMGSAGDAEVRRAEAWMTAQGVARPRAMAGAVAPAVA